MASIFSERTYNKFNRIFSLLKKEGAFTVELDEILKLKQSIYSLWELAIEDLRALKLTKEDRRLLNNKDGFLYYFFIPLAELYASKKSFTRSLLNLERYLRREGREQIITVLIPFPFPMSKSLKRVKLTPNIELKTTFRSDILQALRVDNNIKLFYSCLKITTKVCPTDVSIRGLFKEIQNINTQFRKTVAITTLEEGAIFWDYWFPILEIWPFGTFSHHQLGTIQPFFYRPTNVYYNPYSLSDKGVNATFDRTLLENLSDKIKLKNFFHLFIDINNEKIGLATDFLLIGDQQDILSLKFISYSVAIEAIFSPDDRMEFTYRISLRASLLLKSKYTATQHIFDDINRLLN